MKVWADISSSEKFDQAITDYSAGLKLKTDLLPLSSRQIAEAHYKLSIVLDLTSGRLGDSIVHAERALDSVEARLAELRTALSGQTPVQPAEQEQKEDAKGKGKGKAAGPALLGDDAIVHMTKAQMEAEEKELQGLREDLALKVGAVRSLAVISICGFWRLLAYYIHALTVRGHFFSSYHDRLKSSRRLQTSRPSLHRR